MHALVPPVAVRTAGLVGLAAAAWLVAAADDSPDANIGLGMLLLAGFVLAVAAWGAVDGVRSARRGRPDREGLLAWLLSSAAFALLTSLVVLVGVVVTEGVTAAPPLGPVLSGAVTWASFVAIPAAVAYGLARSLVEPRLSRQG